MKLLTACAVALLATVALLRAEERIELEVPFAFTAGRAQLPAGRCTILIDHYGVLQLSNSEKEGKRFALTSATPAPLSTRATRLVFRKFGGEYFLWRLWTPGMSAAREVIASPAEREMARTLSAEEVFVDGSDEP